MRILCWGRQTGKTAECIGELRKHEDAFMITPTIEMANLHKKDSNRIFSAKEGLVVPKLIRKFQKAIIDEVDLIDTIVVGDLLFHFDVILIAGTPLWKSPNFSWLRKKYPESFAKKRTWKPINEAKEGMSKETHLTEIHAKFKTTFWEDIEFFFMKIMKGQRG